MGSVNACGKRQMVVWAGLLQPDASSAIFAAATDLCATAQVTPTSAAKGPGNTALVLGQCGKQANGSRGNAFDERKLCQTLIHEVLDNLKLEVTFAGKPEVIDGRRHRLSRA
ncbi:hypothetical protein N657DRAFT_642267 [Parathielavia appendiculata]|uniref:Uncharacterized protein n=1 Tax=Parathielavia appendiculata TaxID=2587402 RepID=A0AAN6U3K0_9PEZI|nr:hypothetical protein N657DRAFT_642267 [Parathielavia appendiculata]